MNKLVRNSGSKNGHIEVNKLVKSEQYIQIAKQSTKPNRYLHGWQACIIASSMQHPPKPFQQRHQLFFSVLKLKVGLEAI